MNSSALLDKVLEIVNFQKFSANDGQLLWNNRKKSPEEIRKLLRNRKVLMNSCE